MSAGPGAYLEPEAAAAQIAAGRQGRGFDSDDEQLVFGDNAITVPPKAEAVEAAKKPPEGENGKPAAAPDGVGPVDAENSASGGLKVDPNDPDAQRRFQQQGEHGGGGGAAAAREQEIRRLAVLASGGGEMTTYDGRPVYDNMAGGAAAAALAEGYGGAGSADLGYDGDGGDGRGGKQEADRDNAGAADSDQDSDEEEGVDWDDSADEDVDAATAAAMEQARIGMARAAARELRESRATRWEGAGTARRFCCCCWRRGWWLLLFVAAAAAAAAVCVWIVWWWCGCCGEIVCFAVCGGGGGATVFVGVVSGCGWGRGCFAWWLRLRRRPCSRGGGGGGAVMLERFGRVLLSEVMGVGGVAVRPFSRRWFIPPALLHFEIKECSMFRFPTGKQANPKRV